MSISIQIIFYSMYGHVWKMAEGIAEGARREKDVDVKLYQVPETLSADVLTKMQAKDAKQRFAQVPIAHAEHLSEADAIIFGTPTRFGSACAQMQAFLDSTGSLWQKGALIGKVGSAFTSTASQHGGQESTILSMSTYMYHQGMVIVGCPYSSQELLSLTEISGGSPYGAGTIAGPHGERQPSDNEMKIARHQGQHVARIAGRLKSPHP